MNAFRTLAMAAALAGVTAELGAQGKCEINTGGSPELNGARQYYTKGSSTSGAADEKPKHLRNGVAVLTTERALRHNNQLGRNWLLTRILYQWTMLDAQAMQTTRGAIGFTDNPTQSLDLLAAIDTTLTAVESAAPQCSDSTNMFRRNLFARTYGKGVEALNAEMVDSAEKLFRRALLIQPTNPNGWNGMAILAQKKNDEQGMMDAFEKVIQYGATDTTYARTVEGAINNLGVLKVNRAETLQGEAKTRELRGAETLFREYLKKKPSDANAQQGLARVLSALGDTAAIQGIYANMLQNPDNFSDIQFFEAGSTALRAKQQKMGTQLMEAGLKKNPYHRDGLYNLSAAYFEADDAEKLAPVVRRLVEVDPQNPDNWRLYAGQYQIRNAALQKAKKPVPASVTDSLLAYIKRFNEMKVQITIDQFDHQGAKHTLKGSVINSGEKPVDGTLEIEFLDKDGQVVAKKSTPVKANANETTEWTAEVTQSGVVAYRYKPIS